MSTTRSCPFEAGTILIAAWGDRASNIDFYQVIRTTAKTAVVRRIEAQIVEIVGPTQAVLSPISGAFRSAAQRRSIRQDTDGFYVLVSGWERASLWDGEPRVSARFA